MKKMTIAAFGLWLLPAQAWAMERTGTLPGPGGSVDVRVSTVAGAGQNFVGTPANALEMATNEYRRILHPRPEASVEVLHVGSEAPFWLDSRASPEGQEGAGRILRLIEEAILQEFDGRCSFFEENPSLVAFELSGFSGERLAEGARAIGGLVNALLPPAERNRTAADRPVHVMSCSEGEDAGFATFSVFFVDPTPFSAPETSFYAVLARD